MPDLFGEVTGYVKTEFLAVGESADYLAGIYGVPGNVMAANYTGAPVYSAADYTAPVLGTACEGQELEVVSSDGVFAEVSLFDGSTGYMALSDLSYVPVLETAVPTAAYTAQADTYSDSYYDSSYTDYSGDTYSDMGYGTVYAEDSYETDAPVYEAPVYETPVYEEPVYETEAPVYEEPVYEEPVYETEPPVYRNQCMRQSLRYTRSRLKRQSLPLTSVQMILLFWQPSSTARQEISRGTEKWQSEQSY